MAATQMMKTGSLVQGNKQQYQIVQTLTVEENCVSYLCKDRSGNVYAMDHYQAGCPMLGEPRARFQSLPKLYGVLPTVDTGSEMGLPFDIFPRVGATLSNLSRSTVALIQHIIPQLNAGIEGMHRQGLLIREITPDSVVYDEQSHGAWFRSFCNLAAIHHGATATKAAGKGIKAQYYPPEYPSAGWSIYSDYYAFGIMLLEYVKGIELFAAMQPDRILAAAKAGQLPGIDRNRIEKTAYGLLSIEEKILYLILGLTLPYPHQRWGYHEVRCWCAGQNIPLVQTGEKVRYQMSVPLLINGKQNWDYSQAALSLAQSTSVSDSLLESIAGHISKQNKGLSDALTGILRTKDLSTAGKAFYFVYTLHPLQSGLWWKGACYNTSGELVSAYQKGDHEPLKEMLRNRCFSSLTKLRGLKTEQQKKEYAIFQQLERWESEEADKGASRFVMQMGGSRGQRFLFDGKYYASLEEVLGAYRQNGMDLYRKSSLLLLENSFHSWLWSKGFRDMGQSMAAQSGDDDDAFYSLMSICEKVCTPAGRKAARRMYMRWGPFAQITWLKEHTHYYEEHGGVSASVMGEIKTSDWSDQMPLEALVQSARNHLVAYQNFVRSTSTNPFLIIAGLTEDGSDRLVPVRSDAFFFCTWRKSEVTPAFLKWIGEPIPKDTTDTWCDSARTDAKNRIAQEEEKLRAIPGFIDHTKSSVSIPSQVFGMVVWLMALVGILAVGHAMGSPLLLPVILVSAWFPMQGIFWCYTYSFQSGKSDTDLDKIQRRLDALAQRGRDVDAWHTEIKGDLGGNANGLNLAAGNRMEPLLSMTGISSVADALQGGAYKASLLASNAGLALVPFLLLPFWASTLLVMVAVVYCVSAMALLTRTPYTCSRAFGCTLIIQITNFLLYDFFHTGMVAGAVIILVMIAKNSKK